MVGKEFEIEAAAHDVLAEQACFARFFQRGFKALETLENFAVDIVVAGFRAHGVTRDNHALNQRVRVVHDDVAVFERAGFAFVRVADNIFRTGQGTGHEAPFQAGGEARAAATAQTGCFDFVNHVVLRCFFAQNLAQRLIAAACLIGRQRPAVRVLGVYVFEDYAGLVDCHLDCT